MTPDRNSEMSSIDKIHFPPSILPVLRFRAGRVPVTSADISNEPSLGRVHHLLGVASDIVAFDIMSGQADLGETDPDLIAIVDFQIQIFHTRIISEWDLILAGSGREAKGIWLPVSKPCLSAPVLHKIDRIMETVSHLAREAWPACDEKRSLYLQFGATWRDLSNHEKPQLRMQGAALLQEPPNI